MPCVQPTAEAAQRAKEERAEEGALEALRLVSEGDAGRLGAAAA